MMSTTLLTLIIFVFHRISFSSGLLLFKNRVRERIYQYLPPDSTITQEKYVQKVDHFDPTNVHTWNQLYYQEKSYYKKGGPAYLWVEGEGSANPKWMYVGYWTNHGRQNNASFFLIEHRYYGVSQPFGNASTKNLRYLTTSQALADVASFIIAMNEKHEFPAETKWILFGGSYAANLVAWMRMKYPHLVYGAVASSAPILAQLDFPEYMVVVANSLAAYSNQCRDDIALANQELDQLVRTAEGRKEIGNTFKLCSPLRGRRSDIAYFFLNMEEYIASSVQYDYYGDDIKELCDNMLENEDEIGPVTRYAKLMDMFLNWYGERCLPTNFTRYIELVKNDDAASRAYTDRAWIYQTCTEYGYYQTSRKKENTFSNHVTLPFYLNMCAKIFGPFFNRTLISRSVKKTNTFFGGLEISTSRILFIHGSVDPWHPLGIVAPAKHQNNIHVIYLEGGSHCWDLLPAKETDPPKATEARKNITKIIDSWLRP